MQGMSIRRIISGSAAGLIAASTLLLAGGPAAHAAPGYPGPAASLATFGISSAGWTGNLGSSTNGMFVSLDGRHSLVSAETHYTNQADVEAVLDAWYAPDASNVLRSVHNSPDATVTCTSRAAVTKVCSVTDPTGTLPLSGTSTPNAGFWPSTPGYVMGDPVKVTQFVAVRDKAIVGMVLHTRNSTLPVSVATLRNAVTNWIDTQWAWTPPVPPADSPSIPSAGSLQDKVGNKVVDVSRKANKQYRYTKLKASKLKLPKSTYKVWGKGFNAGKQTKTVYLKTSYMSGPHTLRTVCMKSNAAKIGHPFSATSCNIKGLKKIQ